MTNPVDFIDQADDTLARTRRDLALAHQRADELDRENTELRQAKSFAEWRFVNLLHERNDLKNLLKEVSGTLRQALADLEKLK